MAGPIRSDSKWVLFIKLRLGASHFIAWNRPDRAWNCIGMEGTRPRENKSLSWNCPPPTADVINEQDAVPSLKQAGCAHQHQRWYNGSPSGIWFMLLLFSGMSERRIEAKNADRNRIRNWKEREREGGRFESPPKKRARKQKRLIVFDLRDDE